MSDQNKMVEDYIEMSIKVQEEEDIKIALYCIVSLDYTGTACEYIGRGKEQVEAMMRIYKRSYPHKIFSIVRKD